MLANAFADVAGMFSRAPARFRNATLENPAVSLQDPAAIEQLGGSMAAASGAKVNHQIALTIAPVRQAVRLISCDVAKMKLYPYTQIADDEREIDRKHRSYVATCKKANPWKSSRRFWQDLMTHALMWENGYGYIGFTPNGQIELYNLLPDRTCPEWHQGELIYVTEVGGKLETLWPSQVFHVVGLSLDGTAGSDLVRDARDTLGLYLARRNFESKFFKNGARKGGILTLPGAFTKGARDTLEGDFRKTYEGGDNPFKTIVLREGAKFDDAQATADESQLVEGREADKRDVASFFDLPPSKLGIRDSVSYNSFEQDNLNYLHGCLHHWTDTVADEGDMKLLEEEEFLSGSREFAHDFSDFVQADYKTTAETLCLLRNAEFINANEGRRKLGYNKRTDPGGNDYINPNTKSAQQQGQPGQSEVDELRSKMDTYGIGVRAGAITPQLDDEQRFREECGLPPVGEGPTAAWKEDEGFRRPITLLNANSPHPAGGFGGGGQGDEPAPKPKKAKALASRQSLVADAIGRACRRTGVQARKLANDANAFLKWIDSGADEQRRTFDELTLPVFQALAEGLEDSPAAVVKMTGCAFSGGFMAQLDGLKKLIEPPHKAEDLKENVEKFLNHFERTAPASVAALIMEAFDGPA